MLVQEFSNYLNLGLWYLKLLLCLSFPLIAYVIRKKWEHAVAKEVEIRRLMALVAAETSKAEEEAAEAGYYAAGNVSGAALGFRPKVEVEEGLIGCCHQAPPHTEFAAGNDYGTALGFRPNVEVEEGSIGCCRQDPAYTEFAAGNVNGAALRFRPKVEVEEGSVGCCHQAPVCTEFAAGNVNGAAFGFRGAVKHEQGLIRCCRHAAADTDVVLSNAESRKCAVCLNPTTGRCSRCKSVWYCSTKCQIFHWREGHQEMCYPPSSKLTHSSNLKNYQRPKTCNHKKKVTLAERVETKDREFSSEGNVFSSIDQTKQLNEKSDGNKPKIVEELKQSISTQSFSTAFSSNSPYSSTTSYSSDDTSTTESSSSSDLKKSKACQHDNIDTSNLAKSTIGTSKETKSCDPNVDITAPSKLKTHLLSTEHDSQKTSFSIPTLNSESCDTSIAKSGPSDFWEGALNYRWSGSDKAESHATNDYLSNIGSSSSGGSDLYGKIDESCHVHKKMNGSYSVINEPSKKSVASMKINCSSPEAGIPVLPNANLPKQAKGVDNSVLNNSGDDKSKQSQYEAQKVRISPRSTKKADCTISVTNTISNERCSSASNGNGTVHFEKGDNSRQHFNVSHSQRAKSSSLFAETAGPGIDSSECNRQSVKWNLVGGSHGTHSFIDNGSNISSRVTNVDMMKSNINVATSDKGYACGDHVQAPKLSRHHGADQSGVKKGLLSYELFRSLYGWYKIELQPVGLVNCGNSCYANAVLQCLAFTPPLTAYFLQGLHSKICPKMDWCFTCEFENLILKVKDATSPISPIGIISHIQNIGSHLRNGREEDAHEFLRCVVDTMQSICLKEHISKISGSVKEETTLLSLTFGGYLQSKIRCLNCRNKSERSERIMDLSVEIEGSIRTLEDALKRFTSSETLDGENKYNCDRCKSYQKARKKLTILEAPNILTIALKRFQPGTYGKLSKWIDFPQILNLAPYMSGKSDDNAPVYDLYGVIVHLDTMNATFSGHYVCYVKNAQKKWFKIDDTVVKVSDFGKVKKQSAYMLLYARCMPRAPRYLRDKLISNSKLKATPPLSRRRTLFTHGNGSPNFDSYTRSEAYNHRHSVKFETDSYSDKNSFLSSCSDGNSFSTGISARDSDRLDDIPDLIFGDSIRGLNNFPLNSTLKSDSNFPSISPL